jgi:hypothetical protein
MNLSRSPPLAPSLRPVDQMQMLAGPGPVHPPQYPQAPRPALHLWQIAAALAQWNR